MKNDTINKCIHNRDRFFCCECRYGKIREQSSKHFDCVDELKTPDGYKLLKGHFGDIKQHDN